MSLRELKEQIKAQIEVIEDEAKLQDIKNFIEDETEDNYVLTEEQWKRVEEARAQYRRGEYLTQEEAEKEIDEWLEKDE
ncbi:MAG TPA: hypothetical protein PL009_06535 [Flavipsychrobacter sp.]|nr:hypothetical protein [Flavipsychrobacter sp.]